MPLIFFWESTNSITYRDSFLLNTYDNLCKLSVLDKKKLDQERRIQSDNGEMKNGEQY